MNDLRYAFRALLKKPGFTIVAAITIALGIGASTGIFTIVNGVLLKSLPFPEPEHLVAIGEAAKDDALTAVPFRNYLDWRAQQTTFEEMSARLPAGGIVNGSGQPERVFGRFVTASFFATLKVAPQVGRAFDENEDKRGGERVIVISDGLWRRHFGADPAVVGQPVRYNGGNWTLIGVMPRDFDFYGRENDNNDIFIPLGQLDRSATAIMMHWEFCCSRDANSRSSTVPTLRRWRSLMKSLSGAVFRTLNSNQSSGTASVSEETRSHGARSWA